MQTLLGQQADGTYLYQCTCGELTHKKKKLVGKQVMGKCYHCSDHRVAGGTDHPLYWPFINDYKSLWPSWLDFLLEVSPWPGPKYMLTGKDGHHASPGNAQWVERPKHLFPIYPDTMHNYKGDFYDDALKALHEEAHKEITIGPQSRTAFLAHLARIEEDSRLNPELSLEQQQIQRERESQMFAMERHRIQDDKNHEKERSSQTAPARSIRNKLVPILALRMKDHYLSAMEKGVGTNLDQVAPLVDYIDWDVMAHITVTVVLDLVGRGDGYRTQLTRVFAQIGERLDHQAFYEHIYRTDPDSWERIDRWYLQDDVMGYTSKLRNAKKAAGAHGWNFRNHHQCIEIGNWAWANLQSITDWFDVLRWWDAKNSSTYYLSLSRQGLKYAAVIMAEQDRYSFDCWPMLVKPLDWELDARGGYLKFHPATSRLVRNNKGTTENTTPSQLALDALNKMQSVPFKLNTWIYSIQKVLMTKTNELMNSYEADSFRAIHYPLIPPSTWDLPRVNDNIHPDIKKAKRKIKNFHKQAKKAEKEKVAPERVLRVAARFLHVPEFYLPCFMDGRTRKYYMVDTLNPQGSDRQKALLHFAKGNPVTDANREIVREDLLYTLANCWAEKLEPEDYERLGMPRDSIVKSDKLPENLRIEFGRQLVKEGLTAVTDPLSSAGYSFWSKADEPFQFLSTLREFYSIFEHRKLDLKEAKKVAEVPLGRDASNSGMQIQGGFLRDEKMCLFTNVIPTPVPMDAYEEVAKEVRRLVADKDWIGNQMEKCKESAERNEKERKEKDPEYKMADKTFTFNVALKDITRSILKRASMTTLYGAAWQSKYDYIASEMDELTKKGGQKYSIAEKVTITNAQIKGQKEAFPKSDEIDQWFRSLGGAVLNKAYDNHYVRWETAAGSICVQEYREPITKQTNTYGMGGARYFEILETNEGRSDNVFQLRVQTGWGEVKEHKTQSALAANWTHSQDASIIQFAFSNFDHPFFAVHDCGYTPAGCVGEMTMALKKAYVRVVTSQVLDKLPEYNNVELKIPDKGEVDILDSMNSGYMFS